MFNELLNDIPTFYRCPHKEKIVYIIEDGNNKKKHYAFCLSCKRSIDKLKGFKILSYRPLNGKMEFTSIDLAEVRGRIVDLERKK